MRTPDYTYNDLVSAYKKVGVVSGKTVYVTGNFATLGLYEKRIKSEVLCDHLDVIRMLIGPTGTVVVPTHTWSLCNTNKVFYSKDSRSETGSFSEYVRTRKGSVRQYHPFSSSTALGYKADFICGTSSRHVYGMSSPFQRLIDESSLHVSVGMPIERNISMVHHVEFMMGVPYRYVKEFFHPCDNGGGIVHEPFYLHVLRRDVDIVRGRNKKIMSNYRDANPCFISKIGRGYIESVPLDLFYKSTVDLLSKDIYAWLERPPVNRSSYQK